MSVAMVIPEMGFDELPMRPVMREDTVTKKKPKSTIRMAARKLYWSGIRGASAKKSASSSEPTRTTVSGRSRSVLSRESAAPASALNSRTLSRKDETIVGMVRASVISPAASTAPAPVYLM